MNNVSANALIREMDTCELLEHLHGLACIEDATGQVLQQVTMIRQQYLQLTGQELNEHTPGLTISELALLLAAQEVATAA